MSKKKLDNKIPWSFSMKLEKKLNMENIDDPSELATKNEKTVDSAAKPLKKLKDSFIKKQRKKKIEKSLHKKKERNIKNTKPTINEADILNLTHSITKQRSSSQIQTTNNNNKDMKCSIAKGKTSAANEITQNLPKPNKKAKDKSEPFDIPIKKKKFGQKLQKKNKIQNNKILQTEFNDKIKKIAKKQLIVNENVETETFDKLKMPYFSKTSSLFQTINNKQMQLINEKTKISTTKEIAQSSPKIIKTGENKINSRLNYYCVKGNNDNQISTNQNSNSKWQNFSNNFNKNSWNECEKKEILEQKLKEKPQTDVKEKLVTNLNIKTTNVTNFQTKQNNNDCMQFPIKKKNFTANNAPYSFPKATKVYESKIASRLNCYRKKLNGDSVNPTNKNNNNEWSHYNNNKNASTSTTSTTSATTTMATKPKLNNCFTFETSLFQGKVKNVGTDYTLNDTFFHNNDNNFVNLVTYKSANQRLQNLRSKLAAAIKIQSNGTKNHHYDILHSSEQKKKDDELMDWEPIQQEFFTTFENKNGTILNDKLENSIPEEMSAVENTNHPLFNDVNENLKTIFRDDNIEIKYETDYLYFVLDTNTLLQHLMFIKDLITMKFDDVNGIILFIPYIVIMELDKIKNHRDRSLNLRHSAYRAIRYINIMLESHIGSIQVQSALKDCQHIVDINSPDDKIINCCLQLKENIDKIILLTEDVNLRNKANGCKINATTVTNLIKNEMVIN